MNRRNVLSAAVAASAVAVTGTSQSVQAQSDKPLRIIIGVPPGGSLDNVARAMADKIAAELKRPVVVDNKPGAGTRLAAELLKNAAPDGDTVMMAPIVVPVLAPLTFSKLNYNPSVDFAPIMHLTNFHFGLAVPGDSPHKTVGEFVTWLKANPTRANFGMPGAGSLPHFFGLMIGKESGIEMTPVPFQGGAPMLVALAGGQISSGIDVLGEQYELHRAGKIRILAQSGEKRGKLAPDIPTFREAGFANIQAQGWFAMYAPAKTPMSAINAIAAAGNKALSNPEVLERLGKMSLEAGGGSPADLQKLTEQEFARWTPIIKASGFKAD
jgi:tripartite-type tricarboxylate transporter receptor subunit TctC